MNDVRWIAAQLESAQVGELEDYYPATARGELRAYSHELLFEAGPVYFVGPKDGSVVPIATDRLEMMSENIWDFDKLATLVAECSAQPGFCKLDMGYADIWLEARALAAQVRDGNHRTFAAAVAGADYVPVMIEQGTLQDLRRGERDSLYRAVRAAQREMGWPQLTRARSRPKASTLEALVAAEEAFDEAQESLLHAQQNFLWKHGFVRSGYSEANQLERAGVFWRTRARDLDIDLDEDESALAIEEWHEVRARAFEDVLVAREAAGLDPRRQRLNPVTRKIENF